MLPREEILGLLSSMGVDLPRKTKLPDLELDKRLSKALDSAQYLSRVLPTPPLDPTSYPSWFHDKSNKPVLEAIGRHNIAEATMIDASQMRGIDNPFPLYTNAFMDLRQTLMSIGNACDSGLAPVILQDKGESSGSTVRRPNPIVIVVFHHDAKNSVSRASFDWISSYVSGSATHTAMANITATVQEQHLLLRLLNQNQKRLVSTYKPKRASTESSFALSFLLPVGPLGAQDMAKYNTNNGCTICGEPAKQKCSRCGAVRYCDAVCQKEDWKTHRPLCNGWQGAKWQGLTFVLADRPVPNGLSLRINRYDNRRGAPPNTHGNVPFIVKIQVNSSKAQGPAHTLFPQDPSDDTSNMLIYDQRQILDVALLRSSSEEATPFDAITEVVKAKGDRGIKAFFWAIRTGEWTMDVCLDRFPEWQKW
ncbi:hypothetical protein B0H13DRAFT_1999818 [Mycena leptocephala]|nr:hypothetical protein B0H13DRAFT_1999818 [Mycena leptocephala]